MTTEQARTAKPVVPATRRLNLIDVLEDRVHIAVCLCAVMVSIVGGIFQWSATALMPAIFVVLYGILRIVVPLRKAGQTLADLQTEIGQLRRELARSTNIRVENYPDASAFYEALTRYLRTQCRGNLDTWYVRTETPDSFAEANPPFAEYFQAVLNWSRDVGSVRRLFCAGSKNYVDWTKKHREATRNLPRYKIRMVKWSISADLLSMAIMDNRIVFLAFTVDDRVCGMSIEGGEAAAYFGDYFDRHWASAREVPR
jgi:hypothetical protein